LFSVYSMVMSAWWDWELSG